MEDSEIENLYQKEAEEEKKQREFAERIEKLVKIRHRLQSPAGFWRTKCPKCGARLRIKSIYTERKIFKHFKCPTVSCDYEYALRPFAGGSL